MAAREGLEPPTLALGKLCSIRLSYRATPGGLIACLLACEKEGTHAPEADRPQVLAWG